MLSPNSQHQAPRRGYLHFSRTGRLTVLQPNLQNYYKHGAFTNFVFQNSFLFLHRFSAEDGRHRTEYEQYLNFRTMKAVWTILLLVTSNIFMTFAWYGHLKLQQMKISSGWPLIAVILFSWALAFFEYCAQVPANRIGFNGNGGPFSLMQLKVIQEVISLTVFTVIVTLMFKGQGLQWNHLAAFICLIMAVFFVFLK